MDALLRAVRKSPTVFRDPFGKARHKKLPERWGENKEAVSEGMTFYLKYLGSTLVEELPDGESYGEGTSAKAVRSVVTMAKSAGKKLKKAALNISPKGICMTDLVTKEVLIDTSIYRISFCTADRNHDKVFAFIARNTINETMECHAYLCARRKIAQAVTLTVSEAFSLANDLWEESEQLEKDAKEAQNQWLCVERLEVNGSSNMNHSYFQQKTFSESSSNKVNEVHRVPPPKSHMMEWQGFDEDENLEDGFSRLAEKRSRCLPLFSTDLRKEDLEEGVQQYLDSSKCFEEFSRQKSVEDLLQL